MGPQETSLRAVLQTGFEDAGVVVTAKVCTVGDAVTKELKVVTTVTRSVST